MKKPSAAASSASGASRNDACARLGVGAHTPFAVLLSKSGEIDLNAEESNEQKPPNKLSWILVNKQKLAEWMDNNGGREPLQTKASSKEETAMAKFIVNVKSKYASKSLASTVVQEFESIPWWSWAPKKGTWLRTYDNLKTYLSQNPGDDEDLPTYPARLHPNHEGEEKLALWIKNQRRNFRQGRLSRNQEEQLNALPGWQWAERDMPWKYWYDQIVHWLGEKPEHYLDDLLSLARTRRKKHEMALFLAQQKEAYRRKRGRFMSAYQLQELEKLEDHDKGSHFLPRANDLPWGSFFKALVWWGDNVAGNELPNEVGERPPNHRVNSPSDGWLDLGNWLSWTLKSLEREITDDEHWHGYVPRRLSPEQQNLITNWVEARRARAPDRKKRKKEPESDVDADSDATN